jgi:protein-L-isoaspartate(D-aspartate) O-methyltransferase
MPVGSHFTQDLIRVEKDKDGNLLSRNLGGCRFVKLIGQHGWKD